MCRHCRSQGVGLAPRGPRSTRQDVLSPILPPTPSSLFEPFPLCVHPDATGVDIQTTIRPPIQVSTGWHQCGVLTVCAQRLSALLQTLRFPLIGVVGSVGAGGSPASHS